MRLVIFIVIVMPFQCLSWSENDYEIDAVMDRDVELPCNVTAERENDKLNILAWYGNGSSTAFYSRDLRADDSNIGESSSEESGGRYQLISQEDDGMINLHIRTVRPSDAGRYRCMADFASSPSLNTYIQLNVIEPPRRLWVIYENGTSVATTGAGSNTSKNIGPYYVGDWVQLYCVAFEGKPLANLTWWAAQQKLKDSTTPLSDQRIRSSLSHGPLRREDHGLVLSCTAANNEKTLPLAIDVVVDMYLPPELVSIRDMNASADGSASAGRAFAGQNLFLQCRVLGARPTPDVQWRLNNEALDLVQTVTKEESQRLVISELRLPVDESHDEALVTCCAPSNQREGEALLCSQAMPLIILYKPVLEIVAEGKDINNNTLSIVKGSDLTFNCSYQANPQIGQVTWFYEDDTISPEEDDELWMHPILNLRNVSESAAGEYVCGASNDVGPSYSVPVVLDITYPAFCEDPSIAEYGLGEGETINITCLLAGNPKPIKYQWVFMDQKVNEYQPTQSHNTIETDDATIEFQRPNGTTFNTIFCWGKNGVKHPALPHTPCTFLVTDETVPHPPSDCEAVKSNEIITIICTEGHNGGLPQKFKFSVNELDSNEEITSVVNPEPNFSIPEPKKKDYKFVIIAMNSKGVSKVVEIMKDNIIDNAIDENAKSVVTDITTLAMALCGGVLVLALAACGLVLCSHERGSRHLPREPMDPPLCAYNTDESQCETYHDSEDGSDCNVRRSESFRRATQRYPSCKSYDVRRTGSFHSARYMNGAPEPDPDPKRSDVLRHSACRVHSMQNLAACDHLIMHLPPEPNYHVAKPMNTFYTMPRKTRNKSFTKQIRDDTSEITQTSDGFSLPPPPDEFGTYRAASRIRDMPAKSTPTYTTIKRTPSKHNNDVIISPMNTVGLPTISGPQSMYDRTNPFDDSS